MKIMVTGGAGFIGSNLVEELVEMGDEVTVVDNLHTGSLNNIEGLRDRIKIIDGGVGSLPRMKLGPISQIFHLGIPSSSPMYKQDPSLVGTSINDMLRILEFARKNDSKVVFASSSSVYNGLEPPHKEDMEIKVTDYYTEGRLCMERLAKLYNETQGVSTIALRFFSVYGPHEENKGKYANLVSQFMWSMKRGESPLIYGDGKQTRDFTYVRDVVKACILAMNSSVECDVFNVGTGKSYDLNQLIEILNQILGTRINARYVENPIKNYVQHTLADTSKASSLLKFNHRYGLEDGIKEYTDS